MGCTQDIAEIQVGEHRATLRQYFGRSFTIERDGTWLNHDGVFRPLPLAAIELDGNELIKFCDFSTWETREAAEAFAASQPTQRKSHFARNRDIVNECDVLIGTPPYQAIITKETKGGTAYTVNYAAKQGKPALVVYPDGSVDGQIDLE
jgi:hypothetical protein